MRFVAFCFALTLGFGTQAHAGVIVSTGYNDGPGGNALPNPWITSANTTVIGTGGAGLIPTLTPFYSKTRAPSPRCCRALPSRQAT
jgi:hypothetical protein